MNHTRTRSIPPDRDSRGSATPARHSLRGGARAAIWRSTRSVATAVVALLLSIAGAHATLVLGSLTFEPDPPRPGEATEVTLEMVDPTQLPIEDAVVFIELTPSAGGPTVMGEFSEIAPGIYRSGFTLESGGDYQVLMRDQTFRQEEARVTVPISVGSEALEAVRFVFPPTATTSNRSIATWLLWLIGLPVVAGIVVTAMVLTGGRGEGEETE